ncbi:hypothetical protein BC834DRAFT_969832 [Gloeopeniophorella convolvens]|nr:hypothetical protein BC834DRAFT_969832 [Gloeopeniophorella convolvens]
MSLDADQLERSLLAGQWRAQAGDPAQSDLAKLAKLVLDGEFKDYFASPLAREVLTVRSDALDSLDSLPIKDCRRRARAELARLLTAIACLHAFMQANWTGPDLPLSPLALLGLPATPPPHRHGDGRAAAAHGVAELASVRAPLLDEPVAVAVPADALEPLAEAYADEPDLVGQMWLERGLLEHYQENNRAALECFVRAARATGLQYELTGALGRRTRFQQTDVTQLVLLAESRKRGGDDGKEGGGAGEVSAAKETPEADELAAKLPESLALNDDTLLEQTEFTPPPAALCILLSLCLNVRNTPPRTASPPSKWRPMSRA